MALFPEFVANSTYETGDTVTNKGELWWFRSPHKAPYWTIDVIKLPAVWDPAADYSYVWPEYDYSTGGYKPWKPSPEVVTHNGIFYKKMAYNSSKVGLKPNEAHTSNDETLDINYKLKGYTDQIRTWIPAQSTDYELNHEYSTATPKRRPWQTCLVNLKNLSQRYWESQDVYPMAIAEFNEKAARGNPYFFQEARYWVSPYSGYGTLGPLEYGVSLEVYLKADAYTPEGVTNWPFQSVTTPQEASYCGVAWEHINWAPTWSTLDPQPGPNPNASWHLAEIFAQLLFRFDLVADPSAPGGWRSEYIGGHEVEHKQYEWVVHTHRLFWERTVSLVRWQLRDWTTYAYTFDSTGYPITITVTGRGKDLQFARSSVSMSEKNMSLGYDAVPSPYITMFQPSTADKVRNWPVLRLPPDPNWYPTKVVSEWALYGDEIDGWSPND